MQVNRQSARMAERCVTERQWSVDQNIFYYLFILIIPVIILGGTTVDSCYLEFQGTLWNTSKYPYLDISDLQKWGKN